MMPVLVHMTRLRFRAMLLFSSVSVACFSTIDMRAGYQLR